MGSSSGGEEHVEILEKISRFQPTIRTLIRLLKGLKDQVEKDRKDLSKAQKALLLDKMNVGLIFKVKECIDIVTNLNKMEEQMFYQRAKLDWRKMGDGNNSFFHATLKTKLKQT